MSELSSAEHALKKDVGPLPLGVWVVVIAGAAGVAYVIRKRSGSTHSAAAAQAAATTTADPGSGLSATQGAVNGTGAAVGSSNDVTTNDAWARLVIDGLVAGGADPATVDTAIRKYLTGLPLTAAESQVVSQALRNYHTPPEPVDPITLADVPTAPVLANIPTPAPAPTPAPVATPAPAPVFTTSSGQTFTPTGPTTFPGMPADHSFHTGIYHNGVELTPAQAYAQSGYIATNDLGQHWTPPKPTTPAPKAPVAATKTGTAASKTATGTTAKKK